MSAVLFICLCVTAASAQWPNSDRVDRQFADSTSVLFLEAVRLIRDHYVEARNEEELYGVAGRRLMFALPPHCTEDLPRWVDCTADPATCLLGTIERIAAKCNIDRRALVVSALKLVLKELDPNCALLDARMLKELDVSTSGRFGGIGMAVAQRDGDYVVISCFEGSPAFDAGIKAGDMVLAIDGEPIHDLPLIEVLGKVRGRAGSPIRLTLRLRGSDDTRQITLKRQSIRISPVRHLMLPGGIGYLRIVNFQNSTAPEVARALRQLTGSSRGKLNGLVLDLRDNPGGLFDQGIQVADMFVPSGPMTFLRGRNASLNREFMATGRAPFAHIPVAVLVNRGTASAAEILAAAIRARPDMVVIGEPSFGKASVQGVYQMRNDMALRLTTAHYYTPDGRDIDGRGIEPDVRLEDANPQEKGTRPRGLDLESLRDDEAIAKALEMLQGEQGVGTPFPTLF
ncbi:MAG: S41 family peptidase [Desulfomonile sp.]|nr:S41 family peptidase [Desulfomonile sp.]